MPLQDYQPCEFEPRYLTDEQKAEPMMVIDDLFDYGHLPELRAQLWEWLRVTMTCSFHHLKTDEKINMVYFYEQVCKMIEAAHVIDRQFESKKFEGEA